MGKHRTQRKNEKRSKKDPFKDLTWADLQQWAGTAVLARGQRYQRSRLVQDLARTSRGGLIAWVQGSRRYATKIEQEKKFLVSVCTCPYGGVCKHAVAVVLAYLEQVKRGGTIPSVTDQDQRLQALENTVQEIWDEEDDGDPLDEEIDSTPPRRSRKARRSNGNGWVSFLEQQTQPQLVSLLKDLAQRYPDVRQFLEDRHNTSVGAVSKLIKTMRAEIAALSAEPGWIHHWSGGRDIPDYSRVRDRLEALLAQGYADAVVEVGSELLEAGTRQVEMSDDEGETAEEIASCLDIVFRALPRTSRSPAEQMRWAVEAELADEYEICRGAEEFLARKHPKAAWNTLAEQLAQRLEQERPSQKRDSLSENFQRDRLSDWLIKALERAGRQEAILPVCREEAERTGSYVRLVEQLAKAKQWEEAEQWIRKGIAATEKQRPGIADQLRTAFRELRERRRDWRSAAALHAAEFFRRPSLQRFQALEKAAHRAGCGSDIRTAALRYLETGERPHPSTPSWPLPESELKMASESRPIHAPVTDVLIDIAIAEHRPDEIIRWYDQRRTRPRAPDSGWFEEDRIAEAVVGTYPDRAVAIWKRLAEEQIALTKPKAYEMATDYLGKVQRVLQQSGKVREWQAYLADLRQANLRKRVLVQMLDTLAGRRILEGL